MEAWILFHVPLRSYICLFSFPLSYAKQLYQQKWPLNVYNVYIDFVTKIRFVMNVGCSFLIKFVRLNIALINPSVRVMNTDFFQRSDLNGVFYTFCIYHRWSIAHSWRLTIFLDTLNFWNVDGLQKYSVCINCASDVDAQAITCFETDLMPIFVACVTCNDKHFGNLSLGLNEERCVSYCKRVESKTSY